MCHEPSDRPPPPAVDGGAGAASAERLVLESADGTRFRAFAATAIDPGAPGIVILPDVRGLHPFYEELAVRFAEVGIHATAIDYFGRTAGVGERDDDFEFRAHVHRMTDQGVSADIEAAVAHVRSDAGGGADRVFTVGFCMGGRISYQQAADRDVDGVIAFYGDPVGSGSDESRTPLALAARFRCPVLGLFGGADKAIPAATIDAFRRALEDARVASEIVVYRNAPHSFFDRKFEENPQACDDAWQRVIAFVRS